MQNSSILDLISEEKIKDLIHLGTKLEFKKGTSIFLQGDIGKSFYIVLDGNVSITINSTDGKEVILNKLSSGDAFGEIAMFDQSERTANAIAVVNTLLVSIDRSTFFDFLNKNQPLYEAVIHLLCNRLRWLSAHVESFAFANSMSRIISKLSYFASLEKKEKDILISVSQSDLAKMLGLSREVVNKNLQELQSFGALSIERKAIIVLDLKKMISYQQS